MSNVVHVVSTRFIRLRSQHETVGQTDGQAICDGRIIMTLIDFYIPVCV